jgi:hypothetical protein
MAALFQYARTAAHADLLAWWFSSTIKVPFPVPPNGFDIDPPAEYGALPAWGLVDQDSRLKPG